MKARILSVLLVGGVGIGGLSEVAREAMHLPIPSPTTLVQAAEDFFPTEDTGNNDGPHATVVNAVDGDTVKVRLNGQKETVRLIGIDTPETRDPRVGVECGGPAASENAKRLLPAGKEVKLVFDTSQDRRDRYGRLLAYVDLPDGKSFQEQQLSAGLAKVYVYQGSRFHRLDAFQRVSDEARANRRGVWGSCHTSVPLHSQNAGKQ